MLSCIRSSNVHLILNSFTFTPSGYLFFGLLIIRAGSLCFPNVICLGQQCKDSSGASINVYGWESKMTCRVNINRNNKIRKSQ